MTISKKTVCTHEQFNPFFPPEYQHTLAHTLRLSREGRFPGYKKPGGQKSVALFDQKSILKYARDTFGDFAPECVANLEAAFGMSKPKKKRSSRNV